MIEKIYQIQGIFWIPIYDDFDVESYEVKAVSKRQALIKAKKHWLWKFAKYPPAVVEIKNV